MNELFGDDKISSEMIKTMRDRGNNLLLEIFNKAWKEDEVPKGWTSGLIVPT